MFQQESISSNLCWLTDNRHQSRARHQSEPAAVRNAPATRAARAATRATLPRRPPAADAARLPTRCHGPQIISICCQDRYLNPGRTIPSARITQRRFSPARGPGIALAPAAALLCISRRLTRDELHPEAAAGAAVPAGMRRRCRCSSAAGACLQGAARASACSS